MQNEASYEVTKHDGYIRTRVWGVGKAELFEASAREVTALREAEHINALLCDIRELKPGQEDDIKSEARGIGALWNIHKFDKVAFLTNDSKMTGFVHNSLAVTHLDNKFRIFSSEQEAVAWLKAA